MILLLHRNVFLQIIFSYPRKLIRARVLSEQCECRGVEVECLCCVVLSQSAGLGLAFLRCKYTNT